MAMKSSTTKVSSKKATKKTSKNKTDSSSMQESQLMKLFEDELKDIYWAENALTKAIPKMVKNATSPDLKTALESHLKETLEQVKRLEEVFGLLGKKPVAKKCEAMAGLIKEASEIMKDYDKGAMRDAGIITAGQKVEHYEIASYGTLCQFAKNLGLANAKKILGLTLNEEKGADKKLTEVAETSINLMAAHQKA